MSEYFFEYNSIRCRIHGDGEFPDNWNNAISSFKNEGKAVMATTPQDWIDIVTRTLPEEFIQHLDIALDITDSGIAIAIYTNNPISQSELESESYMLSPEDVNATGAFGHDPHSTVFSRSIRHHDTIADSSYMRIPSSMKGRGIGSQLMRNNIDLLDAVGFRDIKFLPSWDGSLHWPKRGIIADEESIPIIQNHINNFISTAPPYLDCLPLLRSMANFDDGRMVWFIALMDEMVGSETVAQHILGKGDWTGILSLDNSTSVALFDSSLNRNASTDHLILQNAINEIGRDPALASIKQELQSALDANIIHR